MYNHGSIAKFPLYIVTFETYMNDPPGKATTYTTRRLLKRFLKQQELRLLISNMLCVHCILAV